MSDALSHVIGELNNETRITNQSHMPDNYSFNLRVKGWIDMSYGGTHKGKVHWFDDESREGAVTSNGTWYHTHVFTEWDFKPKAGDSIEFDLLHDSVRPVISHVRKS